MRNFFDHPLFILCLPGLLSILGIISIILFREVAVVTILILSVGTIVYGVSLFIYENSFYFHQKEIKRLNHVRYGTK